MTGVAATDFYGVLSRLTGMEDSGNCHRPGGSSLRRARRAYSLLRRSKGKQFRVVGQDAYCIVPRPKTPERSVRVRGRSGGDAAMSGVWLGLLRRQPSPARSAPGLSPPEIVAHSCGCNRTCTCNGVRARRMLNNYTSVRKAWRGAQSRADQTLVGCSDSSVYRFLFD